MLALPYGGFIGFYNQHLILPYKKSDFKNAYDLLPGEFEKTWNHRFRELTDINEWIVRYIRNISGDFIPGMIKGKFLTVKDFDHGFPKIRKSTQVIVINDDGRLDSIVVGNIKEFCLKKFPGKSKYEK